MKPPQQPAVKSRKPSTVVAAYEFVSIQTRSV